MERRQKKSTVDQGRSGASDLGNRPDHRRMLPVCALLLSLLLFVHCVAERRSTQRVQQSATYGQGVFHRSHSGKTRSNLPRLRSKTEQQVGSELIICFRQKSKPIRPFMTNTFHGLINFQRPTRSGRSPGYSCSYRRNADFAARSSRLSNST